MKKTSIALALALLGFAAGSALAGSVAGTGGSTEITQIQNNVLMTKQLQELKMQYEQALATSQSLTRALKNPTDFAGMEQAFTQLQSLAKQASSLSFASQNVDASYRARYAGYEDTLLKQMRSSGQVPANFGQQMETMNADTMSAMRAAMANAGFQADKMGDEASMLAQLRARSNSATGQLEAVQAGNQINGFIAEELRRGRQLNMSMLQSQTAWQSYQAQKAINEEEKKKTDAKALEDGSRKSFDAAMEKARAGASVRYQF